MKYSSIILVNPQMGENIGACARAMKNFGFTSLRIVSPRDGWPNYKAISVSAHAKDIIENAEIFDSLKEATADLELLYATTAMPRDMNKPIISSKFLVEDYNTNLRSGIMFGRESSGLTNEEISIANKVINIHTNSECSSLNIAQAVAIICYELSDIQVVSKSNTQELATQKELQYFFDHTFTELDKKGFFRISEKTKYMQQNIINTFMRIENLSKNELQTLRGIISALTK